VIAIFSLCILRHLANAEKSASRTLGAGKQKRHGKDKKRHEVSDEEHSLATSVKVKSQGQETSRR